jgi:hypothetical protein|tara:strand:+ start:3372 stop:3536 length:165 start_codon:yes stop_codon:yes gene_type:complete
MKNFFKECSDVILLNTTTFTFVSLADIEVILKIGLLLVTIVYTLDKYLYNRKNR